MKQPASEVAWILTQGIPQIWKIINLISIINCAGGTFPRQGISFHDEITIDDQAHRGAKTMKQPFNQPCINPILRKNCGRYTTHHLAHNVILILKKRNLRKFATVKIKRGKLK